MTRVRPIAHVALALAGCSSQLHVPRPAGPEAASFLLFTLGTIYVPQVGATVKRLEHDAARPEIPPRDCGDLPLGYNALRAVGIDERAVFMGGNDAAVIFEL